MRRYFQAHRYRDRTDTAYDSSRRAWRCRDGRVAQGEI